jgi:hypothetical protein
MPKAPPPPWTSRDCRFDHLVAAAIEQGMGKPLSYTGIETPERAYDIKKGIYRCSQHRGVSAYVEWQHSGRWTTKSTNWPPDRQKDGTYTLRFTLVTKASGRKRHIETYGTDRANWPYNPRRGKTQEDVDAWAAQGRTEKGHRRT